MVCQVFFTTHERNKKLAWYMITAGGSLTVQIVGASSPSSCVESDGSGKKEDTTLVSNRKNEFSASPVPVSSRKDVSDLIKK